ncbi:MAG: CPBP family intramembrane glutamic endopeptidase [Acidimicrobiales bacterium]
MTDRPVVGDPSPTPAPQPDPPRWGLGDAVAGFLLGLFLSVLLGSLWIQSAGTDELSVGLFAVTIAGNWIGLGGTVVVVCRRKGSGSLATDFGLRVEKGDIGPGLLAGVLSQLVLIPILYLPVHRLFPNVDVSQEAKKVTDLAQGGGIALIAACIVLGAPLIEELFFRGLLQRSAARRFGPRAAIGVSAVAFGLAHFQPVQLLGLTAFGVVLGVLARRAGRLGPALVAHMAFNATTVVVLVATR